MNYDEFLKTKQIHIEPTGFDIDIEQLNDNLFVWQKYIVKWALKKGKAALFLDTGLGKTIQQLVWADEICKRTNGNVLILAPLAVANQTKAEGEKFGINSTICRTSANLKSGINITNYEMLEHFSADSFVGVVLDESSILKDGTGKIRTEIINKFRNTQYKLACTATPCPNDFAELGNHAEFLGIMTQVEMLSTFFVHDGGDTSKWRLKGHAREKFWEWIANWACVMTNPRDLGFEQDGYDLPPLNISEISVKAETMENSDGQFTLMPETVQTLQERREARRSTLNERVAKAAEIANNSFGSVLIWCDLNAESELLAKKIDGAVEVKGSDTLEHKTDAMLGFANGSVRCLVTKPSICGKGMNWQNCHTMIFVGLSDSFEAYYQAVRRCWRFGQTSPVDVYIVISEKEGAVKANIERKQTDVKMMTRELVKFTKDILKSDIENTCRISESYIATEPIEIPKWIKGA